MAKPEQAISIPLHIASWGIMPIMAKTNTPQTDSKNETATEKPLIAENTKVVIKIDAKTASEGYQKALRRLSAKLKHPGFRLGKVPPKIAEEVLGQDRIIDSALDKLLPVAYQEAIVAAKKKPLTQPSIKAVSLEVGKEWELEAEIAERPELNIAGYEKIAKAAHKAAQTDLEKQVKEAREAHEKNQKELAAAAKTAKKEKKSEASPTPALAEPAPFKEPTEEQKHDFLVQRVYQALVKELKPAIPELLVREEVRYDLDELQNQLQPLNLSIQAYMQRRGMDEQQLSNELAARALGRLQITLLLQEIAKAAKLEVTPAAIDAAIEETKNPEMIAQKENGQYRNLVEQTLLRKAVSEHLLAK
jgi:FKBP-type peptidyl-prolyl cis-trans isomerase (trigger factor)